MNLQKINLKQQSIIKELTQQNDWISFLVYLRIYLTVFCIYYLNIKYKNPFIYFLSIAFIGGRQHTLYILNHEASHGNLFKKSKWNIWISSIFSNFTFFHHPEAYSFVMWKRVHRLHHQYLFTKGDPNYVGRQLAGDCDSKMSRQKILLGMILAGPKAFISFFHGKQDWVEPGSNTYIKYAINHRDALIHSFHHDYEMERERKLKISFFLICFISIHALHLWSAFLLYWIIPMYTFYPFILHMKDVTEHRWSQQGSSKQDILKNSISTRSSILEKIFFSDLNRGFHQEHHFFQTVPFFNLPKLSKIIHNTNEYNRPVPSFLSNFPAHWD